MMASAALPTLPYLRTWSTLTSMGVMLSTSLNKGLGMTPTVEFSSISHHARFTLSDTLPVLQTMVPGTQTGSMQRKASRLYISLLVL